MSKILLNIYIPASGDTLEIKTSCSMKIAELTELLCQYLSGSEKMLFQPSEDVRLCSVKNGEMYPFNAFLTDLKLGNGSTMLLI